jgi:Resolvase, N terminal domain
MMTRHHVLLAAFFVQPDQPAGAFRLQVFDAHLQCRADAGKAVGEVAITLRYAIRDRLAGLGWSQIEVIDDDLGRSAAGSVQRAGFEQTVAEVCLGKGGAVCAREVSRFARNSRDWQQL